MIPTTFWTAKLTSITGICTDQVGTIDFAKTDVFPKENTSEVWKLESTNCQATQWRVQGHVGAEITENSSWKSWVRILRCGLWGKTITALYWRQNPEEPWLTAVKCRNKCRPVAEVTWRVPSNRTTEWNLICPKSKFSTSRGRTLWT